MSAMRSASPILRHLKYTGYRFPYVDHQFVDGLALGITTGKGRHLAPKAAICFLVDDNGVFLHSSILAWESPAVTYSGRGAGGG
jgi:hypothetical protein